jgi:hypothetical protein
MTSKSLIALVLAAAFAGTLGLQAAPLKSAATSDLSSIDGIWRLQMHGLPAVTLTITNEEGNLTGAVLFYLHLGKGQQETATPGAPEPIFHPRFDGKTLTFEVSHRRAHPPETLGDSPITFKLQLDGPDKAQLINEDEASDPHAPVYMLQRSAF